MAFKKYKDLTIEIVEQKSETKLTYPFQHVVGNIDDEKYAELRKFGCSDISDDNGSYLHRDCFRNRYDSNACEKCNFYPIVKKYNEENNIPERIDPDFIKAFLGTDFFPL